MKGREMTEEHNFLRTFILRSFDLLVADMKHVILAMNFV